MHAYKKVRIKFSASVCYTNHARIATNYTDDVKLYCANYIIIAFVSYLPEDGFTLSRNMLH